MDHDCCEKCITGKPRATRRRRNTIWVCPTCSQAWVVRKTYPFGETFWGWDRWPPPGPEQAESVQADPIPPGVPFVVTETGPEMYADPTPPTNVPSPDETVEQYLAGMLSGIPLFTTAHPLDRLPDAKRILSALDDLGYRVVQVR